jgi:hypothetical protein
MSTLDDGRFADVNGFTVSASDVYIDLVLERCTGIIIFQRLKGVECFDSVRDLL